MEKDEQIGDIFKTGESEDVEGISCSEDSAIPSQGRIESLERISETEFRKGLIDGRAICEEQIKVWEISLIRIDAMKKDYMVDQKAGSNLSFYRDSRGNVFYGVDESEPDKKKNRNGGGQYL